jgi:mannose-6-phosphate isomerase-like protein (cupin superfamily)
MKGFHSNIEKSTLENKNFRQVLYTGKHSQLVLMSLKPMEEIGMEVHRDGVLRATKAEAEANGPEFDGVTTE